MLRLYRRKTIGRTIADPNAYLLAMARDAAAKRVGSTRVTATRIDQRARTDRIRNAETDTLARARSEPTERAVKSVVASARRRGLDPAEVIGAWRSSVAGRGFPSHAAADASLHAFATARLFTARPGAAA
jgi:hypothetical protein